MELRLSGIVLISVVLFIPGCITQETGEKYEQIATSTTPVITSIIPTTTTEAIFHRLSLGKPCSENEECLSGCCDSIKGRKICQTSSFCTCRYLNEENCQRKDCYWCIDKCQNEPCGDCSKYKRCLTFTEGDKNVTMVEISQGGNGSCKYNGFYEVASGNESYCDKHEGTRIYGKCGSPATLEDCIRIYGKHCCYDIAQRRSFHSPQGEEYDLWCFKCDKATLVE